MKCSEVAQLLYEYLDGEIDDKTANEIRKHLSQCGHCFKYFDFEQTYLKFIEARTRARRAPDELRKSLLQSLLSEDARSESDSDH